MSVQTKVADLKVGDFILDGIVSRVDVVLHHWDETYMHVTDGNHYTNVLRLSPDAEVTRFDDWTEDDWQEYLLP